MQAENVLRFPVQPRKVDPRHAFAIAYYRAQITKAEYDLICAQSGLAQLAGEDTAKGRFRTARDGALDRYMQATLDLAVTPATSRQQAETKRLAIGRVWLKAEGAFYDALRAGVAADRERLGL